MYPKVNFTLEQNSKMKAAIHVSFVLLIQSIQIRLIAAKERLECKQILKKETLVKGSNYEMSRSARTKSIQSWYRGIKSKQTNDIRGGKVG